MGVISHTKINIETVKQSVVDLYENRWEGNSGWFSADEIALQAAKSHIGDGSASRLREIVNRGRLPIALAVAERVVPSALEQLEAEGVIRSANDGMYPDDDGLPSHALCDGRVFRLAGTE